MRVSTLEIDGLSLDTIEEALHQIQESICAMVVQADPEGYFKEDRWERPGAGGGRTRIFEHGKVFEKGGVNFSRVSGNRLPPSATAKNKMLEGRSYEAMGVSVVLHPTNPFIPTSHFNVRFFVAMAEDEAPIWWFGGGFDLTPYYPFEEDCVLWHKKAKEACDTLDESLYEQYKAWCDRYFYLQHRGETRGVGGLFFDDLRDYDVQECFAFIQEVARAYEHAYAQIVSKRVETPYEKQHRDFQSYRRGRYVEFNLVYDRGTLFGLQSGGRTESILMSMPPVAHWAYRYEPTQGSPESRLAEFLVPRDWLTQQRHA
tara:strand:+ start:9506 stop:10450 length:945 start_codon:yes stop_codon:yes gene_type:complete